MEGNVVKLSQNKQQRDGKDETDDDGFKITETRDQKPRIKGVHKLEARIIRL